MTQKQQRNASQRSANHAAARAPPRCSEFDKFHDDVGMINDIINILLTFIDICGAVRSTALATLASTTLHQTNSTLSSTTLITEGTSVRKARACAGTAATATAVARTSHTRQFLGTPGHVGGTAPVVGEVAPTQSFGVINAQVTHSTARL